MLFNFNDEIKEVEVSDELYNKNNLLDNMYEIYEEYDLESQDEHKYREQYNSHEEQFIEMLIAEIEKNYRKVDVKNFEYCVYFPKESQKAKGIFLRIRAKDDKEMLNIGFSDEELLSIINRVKKI